MGANWLTQSIYKPSIVRERNSVTADPQARKLNSCDRAAIGNTAFTFVLTCKGGGIYFRRMGLTLAISAGLASPQQLLTV